MKRKKNNTPKRLLYKRDQRLRAAPAWIAKYDGKNIVEGYRRRYCVDRMTALIELRILGQPITDETIQAQRDTEARLAAERAKQRESRERKEAEGLRCDWQDDTFAFIAGYTSGGAPFGITWEEWQLIDEEEGRGT